MINEKAAQVKSLRGLFILSASSQSDGLIYDPFGDEKKRLNTHIHIHEKYLGI